MATSNDNSYIAGFKVNYSSDTDKSSNSARSSNASLLTSIQQIDSKNNNNINEKLKEGKYGVKEKVEDSGYFKRLKFSTSSLLKRNKNMNNLVKPEVDAYSMKFFDSTQDIDCLPDEKTLGSSTMQKVNHRKFHLLKPSDSNFFSFLRTKKEAKPQMIPTTSSKNEYEFLDKMVIAERCRISIECKNNTISIEGHKKCN